MATSRKGGRNFWTFTQHLSRATQINEAMKLAAAKAIADGISAAELNEEYIVPSVFNRRVARQVARAVAAAAHRSGVARRRSS